MPAWPPAREDTLTEGHSFDYDPEAKAPSHPNGAPVRDHVRRNAGVRGAHDGETARQTPALSEVVATRRSRTRSRRADQSERRRRRNRAVGSSQSGNGGGVLSRVLGGLRRRARSEASMAALNPGVPHRYPDAYHALSNVLRHHLRLRHHPWAANPRRLLAASCTWADSPRDARPSHETWLVASRQPCRAASNGTLLIQSRAGRDAMDRLVRSCDRR